MLLPEVAAAEAPVAAPVPVTPPQEISASLEGRLQTIEARLAADENALLNNPELAWLRRFHLSGFIPAAQLLIQSYNASRFAELDGRGSTAGDLREQRGHQARRHDDERDFLSPPARAAEDRVHAQ